ncbi:hypothetical protein CRG98_021702 [Punica granatum]|uniref:Retrovirus-related Pol polyprotein from transposon TNT 1-94 n=1 Tax=Punica granatum TaxID=22663 RepID=A0A2I0JNP7_PUNGR|nr:hypothetical protein CRG98_021702 [Punica granatum]
MSGARFMVEKFEGTNDFGLWQVKMKALLVHHGLEGALRREDKSDPTLTTDQKKPVMAKALSIIQLSLSNKVLWEVSNMDLAPEMWKKLESLYMQMSLTNRLYLKQRLYKLRLSLGTFVSDHLDLFNQILMDLANVDVKIEDEDQIMLLLCSLSKSSESFVNTILYERTSIILEDVKVLLNSRGLQEKVIGYQRSDGEGLISKGRSTEKRSRCSCKSRRRKRTSWIYDEEGHLKRDCQRGKVKASASIGVTEQSDREGDILSVTADRGTKTLTISGLVRRASGIRKILISLGSLDTLGYKYRGKCGVLKVLKGALMVMKEVLLDKIYILQSKAGTTTAFERLTLEEKYLGDLVPSKCKSGNRGQVEKPVMKVEFMVEDPETLETQPVVVEDVQIGMSEGRQPSLWNNSRIRDRQREHVRPRDRFGFIELVVLGNAEVRDTTYRRVSFGVCRKGKLRKPSTSKKSKGGLYWSDTHAR